MIVLDTHAWIWWVSSPEFLSETAKQIIDEAATEKMFLFPPSALGKLPYLSHEAD